MVVFTVQKVEQLRELLTGADGIPADLAVVYSDTICRNSIPYVSCPP